MKRTIRILLVVAVALACAGCGDTEDIFVKEVYRVAEAGLTNRIGEVNFRLVTRFEWETLFIFGPYTPLRRMHAELGYAWKPAQWTQIESSETFYLLVFTRAGKVVRYYKFPRTLGEFRLIEGVGRLSRDEATFEVRQSDDGLSKRLIFIPKRGGSSASACPVQKVRPDSL